MANTYHQVYIQSIFAVKYRNAYIHKSWRPELQKVIGNLINEMGNKCIIVNGVEDHMHCFFALKPDISISEAMQRIKSKSSKWINKSNFVNHKFEWQKGFGCFSYGKSQIPNVYQYIQNQEAHHRQWDFLDEYTALLKKFEIDFDENYIFHKPI
ncbi:IS200/IS605 family transposase [Echinicola rosea]|uniref:Transposase IS200-like domain-containing protein n=1 Tax=Echinicola rosea TaxID=1807691 RepID=A0ABQ1UVK2_9BACT|nr:IS200/IS605 family transposase [Echinicola rosea]GGF28201.1 hypothetical protein GCM10011339_15480 [Echinicola rosea]